MAVEVGSLDAPAKPDHQHVIQEQLQQIEYCINDSPSWVETFFLGFQHYLTMLGTNVLIPTLLVPEMGGSDIERAQVIQTLLFVSGINTFAQTFLGTRLPVVESGSYAFVIPILTICRSHQLHTIVDEHERFVHTMRAIQGALICSSAIQIALGFSGMWGVFCRFMNPLTISPIILLAGLGLYEHGFPAVGQCIQIGIPQILVVIMFSQYFKSVRARKKIPIFERFPILLGVIVTWAYAHLLTVSGAYRHSSRLGAAHCRTDRSNLIASTPWVRIPYPLEWGDPTFRASHVFGMMAGVLVSLAESTGTLYGAARLAGTTPPPSSVLSRGIGWQGIGIMLNGLFGTLTGSSISVENAGLVGLTRIGSRRAVQISAVLMIFFSLFGKFGAIIASIPAPIFAGIYCILFGVLASSGLSYLQFVNLNLPRNLLILGFSVFMGLSVPRYFKDFTMVAGHGPVHTNAHWFDDLFNTTFSSGSMVALIVGLTLDNTLRKRISKKDVGEGWWQGFFKFGDDMRSEEFFKLPFNLNNYFPPP